MLDVFLNCLVFIGCQFIFKCEVLKADSKFYVFVQDLLTDGYQHRLIHWGNLQLSIFVVLLFSLWVGQIPQKEL